MTIEYLVPSANATTSGNQILLSNNYTLINEGVANANGSLNATILDLADVHDAIWTLTDLAGFGTVNSATFRVRARFINPGSGDTATYRLRLTVGGSTYDLTWIQSEAGNGFVDKTISVGTFTEAQYNAATVTLTQSVYSKDMGPDGLYLDVDCFELEVDYTSTITGDLDATDVNDTAALTGKITTFGDLDATEAIDTAALTGKITTFGALAVTDTNDTAALAGEVGAEAPLEGDMAATESVDRAAINKVGVHEYKFFGGDAGSIVSSITVVFDATPVEGERLLVQTRAGVQGIPQLGDSTPPAGWTRLSDAANGIYRIESFVKIAGPSETNSYTFATVDVSANPCNANAYAYRLSPSVISNYSASFNGTAFLDGVPFDWGYGPFVAPAGNLFIGLVNTNPTFELTFDSGLSVIESFSSSGGTHVNGHLTGTDPTITIDADGTANQQGIVVRVNDVREIEKLYCSDDHDPAYIVDHKLSDIQGTPTTHTTIPRTFTTWSGPTRYYRIPVVDARNDLAIPDWIRTSLKVTNLDNCELRVRVERASTEDVSLGFLNSRITDSYEGQIITTTGTYIEDWGPALIGTWEFDELDTIAIHIRTRKVLTEGNDGVATIAINDADSFMLLGPTVEGDLTPTEATDIAAITGEVTGDAPRDVIGITEVVAVVTSDATVNRGRQVDGLVETVAVVTGDAEIAIGREVNGITEAVAVTTPNATVSRGREVIGITEVVSIVENDAEITIGRDVVGSTEVILVTENDSDVGLGRDVTGFSEAVTITTPDAVVSRGRTVVCDTELVTIVESLATVTKDVSRNVVCITAPVTMITAPATVIRGRELTCSTETITIAASSADVILGRTVTGLTEAVAIAANDATITRPRSVVGVTEVVVVASNLAEVLKGRDVVGATEAVLVSSNDATITTGREVAGVTEAVAITTPLATVTKNISRNVVGVTETVSIIAADADVSRGREVIGETEVVTIVANQAEVLRGRSVAGITEVVVITTPPATIIIDISRNVVCSTEELMISANDAFISRGSITRRIYIVG